jgi:hypothetical protein
MNKDDISSHLPLAEQDSRQPIHHSDTNSSHQSASSAKSETARKNGQKSRGPKTARGKSISRWNAVKHGLTAKRLLISEGKHLNEYADYQQLLQELLEELQPTRVEDRLAIEKQVMDAWRLRRSFKFELTVTEKQYDGMASICMPNVLRYSALVHRQWAESHRQVCEIRQWTEQQLDNEEQIAADSAAAPEPTNAESSEEEHDVPSVNYSGNAQPLSQTKVAVLQRVSTDGEEDIA